MYQCSYMYIGMRVSVSFHVHPGACMSTHESTYTCIGIIETQLVSGLLKLRVWYSCLSSLVACVLHK